MTTPDPLRVAAEAALTDFIYEHGSDFDPVQWPGFAALRAALAAQPAPPLDVELAGIAMRRTMERHGWATVPPDWASWEAVETTFAREYAALSEPKP